MLSALIPTRLRYPAMPLVGQLDHKRSVHSGPLVLRTTPLKSPAPTTDRDRTVSRRSEPSSRTALMGEQPNPWELLHPQDAMNRHRGAKPERRCELLTPISLLSPSYLLSVERWPFHAEPPDHYVLLSYLLDSLVSQSTWFVPLCPFANGTASVPSVPLRLGGLPYESDPRRSSIRRRRASTLAFRKFRTFTII